MSVEKLLKTFTARELIDAKDAVAEYMNPDIPHKPAAWYGLPLEKGFALDAELAKSPKPQPKS